MRVSGAITIRLGSSRAPMRIGVKRGWTDTKSSCSDVDDDLTDLLARFDEAMGFGDVFEGKGAGDGRMQRAVREACAHEPLQRRPFLVVARERRQGDPADGQVA